MGFDLTGLNPQISGKEPERPDDLFNLSQAEQNKYFKAREKYLEKNKGVYFRNNVWWWRPLAQYVLEFTQVIDEDKKQSWHYNDFTEIDETHAKQIHKQLEALINKGHTKRFSLHWEARRKTLEENNKKVEKELETFCKSVCKKLNKTSLAPNEFPTEDKKKWDKIYKKKNSDANYPFSIENVEEFSQFCKYSGGFTIG
jgi:hypothetical protein